MAVFDFFVCLIIVNKGNGPVKIKEANKQFEVYVGRSLTLHMFCFLVIDSDRPSQSQRTQTGNLVSQLQLEAITCGQHKVRENGVITTCFSFSSDWMTKRSEFFLANRVALVVRQKQCKRK